MKFAKNNNSKEQNNGYWKILVVDDEKSVHTLTSIVLDDFNFDNKKIELIDAFSAKEAREVLKNSSDISMILLDVVMETDEAGLNLVKYIREELKNQEVRIVIRTGQAGVAPEEDVIQQYDINDYKDKTELTNIKLFTTIYASIRSYRDIINQKETLTRLRDQQQLLQEQSKMASMGEMLESIAHQWRQPLSVITVAASGMKMQKEFDILTDEQFYNTSDSITNAATHLSETIDDFRDFFKKDKKREPFSLKFALQRSLELLSSKLKNSGIDIVEDIDDIEIIGLKNEMVQVFMNILGNANDALKNIKIEKKYIFVSIHKEDDKNVITIKDNGGGIPENIIDNVFDSHFTTKGEEDGTGIGLYMSKQIIENHMNGILSVKNIEYKYEDVSYKGAEFKIII
ncbi:MAG: hybrid sensor histidine kinase/response regulator [Campylobacterota bacterium]|nr:hybrid sensor histidine kinase/response regulator [Campylobacterota bacterium]